MPFSSGSTPPKVVLCVKQGTFGDTTQESADSYFLNCVVEPLQELKREDPHTQKSSPAACVEIVDTLAQAKERLTQGGVDVVILNSRSMIHAARELKKMYPRILVVVLTGLIPQDEIVLVDKGWFHGAAIADIVLHTSQGL